ncbi:MAG TPA: ABC transporter permease [Acidimicrobiales bacterium]|nr:ABC transporter permease [Acidimicrobiales bacterium]
MSSLPAAVATRARRYAQLSGRARELGQTVGIFVVAAVLLAVFAETAGAFLTAGNVRNILIQTSVLGVVAVGETMVMLTGGIDLSVGAMAFVGEVLTADLTTPAGAAGQSLASTGVHSWELALLVALLVTGCLGLLNGLLVAVVRIPAILATLASLLVATGIGELVLNLRYLMVTAPIFEDMYTKNIVFNLPGMVVVMFAFYVVGTVAMRRTRYGRNVYAIGGNPRAARLSGLPVTRTTIVVYTLTGVLCGVGGFLTVCQLGMVSSNDLQSLNFQTIIAVLLGGLSVARGGVGRLERTLVGVVIFGMLTNYQTIKGVGSSYQQALLGGLLVAAVVADRLLRGRE